MTTPRIADGRVRAYAQFIAAIFYYFLVRAISNHGAHGLFNDQWAPLFEQVMLVFLLLLGFSGFGFTLNGQQHPISAQGLPRREGWIREAGLGLALGWAIALICAIALLMGGGIAIRFQGNLAAWAWFLIDAAFFAFLALAEEIAFRGYAFQRFARALGPIGAVLGFAAFYAFLQGLRPGSNRASTAVAIVLSVLLSTAYLRTRALWVSWGINFGWKAARALIFGLAVSGVSNQSPVVQGDPMGSFWLTGGGYGLDASWVAFLVLIAAFLLVFRITRDLDFRYNAPEIVAGGIPVDLDAAARRQHEAAMGPAEPTPPALIQIAPVASTSFSTSLLPGSPIRLPSGSAPDLDVPPPISGNES